MKAGQVPKHSGLTGRQKAALALDARRAFDVLREAGAMEDDAGFEEWRHAEVQRACGKDGLRAARQDDFRPIRSHFYYLAGRDAEAFDLGLRTGPAQATGGESVEDRELARWEVIREAKKLGFSGAYIAAVLRGRFSGRRLEDLTAREAWQVVFTLRNRAAARDGRGDPKARNKSQRNTT